MRFLAGARISRWQVMRLGGESPGKVDDDKVTITILFADGSIGTLHYLANGHASFPKERIEVFCGGKVLQLDNFRRLRGFGWNGFTKDNLWKQDKGQTACVEAFIGAIRAGAESPIPFNEILEVARVTIAIGEMARV
jgi:predicted dehydrogenase